MTFTSDHIPRRPPFCFGGSVDVDAVVGADADVAVAAAAAVVVEAEVDAEGSSTTGSFMELTIESSPL